MFGDPQMLAYAGIGAALYALVLVAIVAYPFTLWRSDSSRAFFDFLAFLLLPVAALAVYYLGFNHWIEQHYRELSGSKWYYLVAAFQGCQRLLSGATWLLFAEVITVAGVGVILAWVLRLILRGLGGLLGSARKPGRASAASGQEAQPANATPVWRRKGVGLTAGAAIVALVIFGWAWNAGYVPGNPRAVNKTLVAKVLRESKPDPRRYNNQGRACVSIAISNSRPPQELQSFEQGQVIPWAYSVLLDKDDEGATSRIRQQMEVMKSAGFFSQDAEDVEAGNGKKYSRYRLTWDGWRNMDERSRCFRYGRMEVDTVNTMEYQGESAMGVETWNVQFKYQLKDAAAWASSDQAQAVFPEIRTALAGLPASVLLSRTANGWFEQASLIEKEMNSLSGMANAGMRMMKKPIPASFGESEARDLIADNKTFANACVDIPQSSNNNLFYRDPAQPQGFVRLRSGDPVPAYTGTVLNIVPATSGGGSTAANNMRRSDYLTAPWKRLEMLASAGILERTISTTVPDPRNAQAAGAITYTMAETYQKAMTFMDPASPNAYSTCLRLGSLNVDRVSIERMPESYAMVVKGHASLKSPAPWISDELGKALPDVEYVRKQGVYFTASISAPEYVANGESDTPRTAQLSLLMPRINYAAIKPPYETIPELKIAEADLAALAAQPAPAPVQIPPAKPGTKPSPLR